MNLLPQRQQKLQSIVSDYISKECECEVLSPLALSLKMDTRQLQIEASAYHTIAKFHRWANLTPNGMMMPKFENAACFTRFTREFFRMLSIWNMLGKFKAWNVPAIRYKGHEFTSEQAVRPRASEYAHSDSWLGWDSSAIVFMIPLLGDCEHNGVRFFDHELDETWIAKQPSFTCSAATEMLSRATPLPYDYKIGRVYPNDIGIIHQTQRQEGAGWRVSAEVVGYLEEPHPDSFGAHTAFSAAQARALLTGFARFEAKLNMGQIGAYDEQGRAIDVTLVNK